MVVGIVSVQTIMVGPMNMEKIVHGMKYTIVLVVQGMDQPEAQTIHPPLKRVASKLIV